MTLWRNDYNAITPVALKVNDVPPDNALILALPLKQQTESPPCNVLYAAKNSRVVWFPGIFLPGVKNGLLAAYHRNLTLASLQVESLCGLIGASKDMLKYPIPPVHSERLRRALINLEQLYGGQSSYHSYSTRVQLDWHAGLKDIVNNAMTFWNLDQLARVMPV